MSRNKTKKRRNYINKRIRKNIDMICNEHSCKYVYHVFHGGKFIGYCKFYNKYLNTFIKPYYRRCDDCLIWKIVL
jgi:hypothetical protein